MMPTYEAVLQPNGYLQFLDLAATSPLTPRRVLVTFTEEFVSADTAVCGATLSESALAQDWQRDEEDAAWAHLQPECHFRVVRVIVSLLQSGASR